MDAVDPTSALIESELDILKKTDFTEHLEAFNKIETMISWIEEGSVNVKIKTFKQILELYERELNNVNNTSRKQKIDVLNLQLNVYETQFSQELDLSEYFRRTKNVSLTAIAKSLDNYKNADKLRSLLFSDRTGTVFTTADQLDETERRLKFQEEINLRVKKSHEKQEKIDQQSLDDFF